MGQKVNPYGFRLGIIRESRGKWFAEGREYRDRLVEDLQARKTIHERHHHAGISDVVIERAADTTTVTIESAKPGIVIGRGGSDVDRLRRDLDEIMSGRVRVNVEETKNPETRAQLIAEEIASQIERRASIRRAMSQAIDRAMRVGVDGIRVAVSGRLMGTEIARTERMGPEGSVPLHTLRADVEKGFSEAVTAYGHIGVQVYVCNGEILPPPPSPPEGQQEPEEEEPEGEATEQVAGEETIEQVETGEAPPEEPVAEEAVEETEETTASTARDEGETPDMDDLLADSGDEEMAAVSASTAQAEARVETEAVTEAREEAPVEESAEAEDVEAAEAEEVAEADESPEAEEAAEVAEVDEAEEVEEAEEIEEADEAEDVEQDTDENAEEDAGDADA